jgi:hypothetical protein
VWQYKTQVQFRWLHLLAFLTTDFSSLTIVTGKMLGEFVMTTRCLIGHISFCYPVWNVRQPLENPFRRENVTEMVHLDS